MKAKAVFKTYNQSQLSLLPPSYDDLVPSNHPVRIVNTIIDQIDISALERSYKGGGTSSYHPRMLLKVTIYAYLRNMYSSRKIEQALQENIHFIWLSGQSKPDHNTINDFRGKRLKGKFKNIFNLLGFNSPMLASFFPFWNLGFVFLGFDTSYACIEVVHSGGAFTGRSGSTIFKRAFC